MSNKEKLNTLKILNEFAVSYLKINTPDGEQTNHNHWRNDLYKALEIPQSKYRITLNSSEGVWEINGTQINEEIFQEEKSDYYIIDRSDEIQNLTIYISESESESEKTLMLEDLKQLQNMTDEYIYSSVGTNEYIGTDNMNMFSEISETILELSKKYNDK